MPQGPLVLGIDETLERRQEKRTMAKGIYRYLRREGQRPLVGLCDGVGTNLSTLAYAEERDERHKLLTRRVDQLLLLVRRWYPEREIATVVDGTTPL